MQTFASLKISSRIMLLGFIAFLGMASMVALYWEHSRTEAKLRDEMARLETLRMTVNDIGDEIADAATVAGQFRAMPAPDDLSGFQAAVARAIDLVGQTTNQLDEIGITQHEELAAGIAELLADFEQVFQAQELLGFAPDAGLQGSMQSAAEKVEALTNASENAELLLSMAILRQHEKNFMLWGNPEVIKDFDTQLETTKAQLRKAYPAGAQRMRIAQALDKYVVSFRLYLSGVGKLVEATNTLDAARGRSEDAMRNLHLSISNKHSEAKTATQAVRAQANRTAIALIGLTGFAIFAGVWFVGRSITGPIKVLVAELKRLASGQTDFEISFRTQKNEFGQIAQACEVFRQSAITRQRLEKEAEDARLRASEEQESIRRQSDVVAQEKLVSATQGIAEGLQRLANGDLTFVLTQNLAPEFEGLRDDLNQTVARLSHLLQDISIASRFIDGGSRQISEEAEHLAVRTSSQAAMVEETAAALNAISEKVQASAQRSEGVRAAVRSVTISMVRTETLVKNAVDSMERIERSSQSIASIIKVIDDMAFQTNLLALNAGVEAARAGEAGNGFAVVAHEVRELAQRSALAAKEIKQLIHRSGEEVSDGAQYVRETGGALSAIGRQVEIIAAHMEQIATAANEQSETVLEVNAALSGLDRVTQQNTALVESNRTASRRLEEQANRLNGLVQTFKLNNEEILDSVDKVDSQFSGSMMARGDLMDMERWII